MSHIIDDEPIPGKVRDQLQYHIDHCDKCQNELKRLKRLDNTLKRVMQEKVAHHISTNRLGNFLDGKIKSPAEKLEIEAHLKSCKNCQETVDQLTALNAEWAEYYKNFSPFSEDTSGLKNVFNKIIAIFTSIRTKVILVVHYPWMQVSLATAIVAIIVFLMIIKFQSPTLEIPPIKDDVIVSKQDSIKTDETDQLVDRQLPQEDKQDIPGKKGEKKPHDKWQEIKKVFAENYRPTPYLEELLAYENRSYSITVLTPKIGEKITGEILFQWEGIDEKQIYLKILNNKGAVLFSLITENNKYRFTQKLNPGLYYWKLESDDDVLFVGKILVGEPVINNQLK